MLRVEKIISILFNTCTSAWLFLYSFLTNMLSFHHFTSIKSFHHHSTPSSFHHHSIHQSSHAPFINHHFTIITSTPLPINHFTINHHFAHFTIIITPTPLPINHPSLSFCHHSTPSNHHLPSLHFTP